ncbi:hypothetical protein LCGC14_0963630 [marine sediment metagenome]|uniref:Uncharacterized protein n=1 Tax=marine sediment metagenome TaxID=412755 RepID=A0A0F9NDS6_9ZZZZ|nr:hypothetical protein [Candidatus Aminicenantes bacterium]
MKTEEKQRTLKQNRALHLWFNHLSEELNNAGLDLKQTLRHDAEIPWSSFLVKECLFRPIMKAQFGFSTTTKLSTKQIDEVFDTVNRYISDLGIHVPFPSIESIMMKQRQNEN